MNKEIPILFSTPMVRAIIGGRKTMTRRILTKNNSKCGTLLTGDGQGWRSFDFNDVVVDGKTGDQQYLKVAVPEDGTRHRIFSKWFVDDVLWVRETWAEFYGGSSNYKVVPIYKAKENAEWIKWKPSIHMKKDYARIWLKVTGIKVERLQDISEEDAKAEGVILEQPTPQHHYHAAKSYREEFMNLWSKINGAESWNENPFVWAIEFEVLSTTGKGHPSGIITFKDGKFTTPEWTQENEFLSNNPFCEK